MIIYWEVRSPIQAQASPVHHNDVHLSSPIPDPLDILANEMLQAS
jgi:hypothetical protein